MAGKHILVLGAYGFIGAEVVRGLRAAGHEVTGLGRDAVAARRVLPDVPFRQADLRALVTPAAWAPLLDGIDLVINCAGALQDGGPDDLAAVHHAAIAALGQAGARAGTGVIQISAAGVSARASTAFFRTKAAGDAALLASGARVWVLRPGLVIGQGSFGGTGLLRMLAAVPLVQPVALPEAQVQTVGMSDLVAAVRQAVDGDLPAGSYDLVEATPRPLADVLDCTRSWLGFAPARWRMRIPDALAFATARLADLLGHLGWRAPLRSTALTVLRAGVIGDPGPYRAATGRTPAPLPETLASLAAGREHRLAARMALALPLCVATLALFWLCSGVIGLAQREQAAALLTATGWPASLAMTGVLAGSVIDLALGGAMLWRRWAGPACLGQIAVSLAYLAAATLILPGLWADPLGPLVKILPAMMLSLVTRQMLETR